MEGSTDLKKTLSDLVVTFGAYEYIFALLDLLFNGFHIFVLSRRNMRTTSMNSILLGIAFVDMVFPVIAIKKQFRIWLFGSSVCVTPMGYIETNVDWLLYSLRDDFRRCSTWLGLSLAAVRTVSVRNSLNNRFNFISQRSFGWKLVFSVVALSTFLSVFYWLRFRIQANGTLWSPPSSCVDFELGFTKPVYVYEEQTLFTFANGIFKKIYFLLVGILAKFVPCLLFPAFTYLLIKELARAKSARKRAKHDENTLQWKDLTTRLVIYMTVSFFVIEFPIGICFWVEAMSSAFDSTSVATSIIQILNIIYVAMTLSHSVICFSMSSQYRRTVKRIFSREKPKNAAAFVSVLHGAKSETSAFH